MRVDLNYFPEFFDPAANMTNSGWTILNSTSLTLFDLAENQNLVGRLAKEWHSFEDGKRYEVRIRKDAKFHNGSPVTAEDVLFSLKRKQNIWPDYELFNWIDPKKANSITLKNNDTIEFRLNKPYPYFLFILALPGTGIVPRKVYPEQSAYPDLPILAGPYKFAERSKDQIKLKWFDEWIEKNQGQPREIIVYDKSEQDRLKRFINGETDIFFDIQNQFTKNTFDFDPIKKFRVHFPNFNTVLFAYFNATSGPLRDPHLRDAFGEVLKRFAQTQKRDSRSTILADQFFPPGYSGRTKEYVQPTPDKRFDSYFEQLKKKPVSLTHIVVPGFLKDNVSPVTEFAKALGFNIITELMSNEEIKRRRNIGEGFDFAYWLIPIPPGDPCLVFRLDFGPDDFFVKDPNGGYLYKMIQETSTGGSLEHRIGLAKQIDDYIAKEKFIVPIIFRNAPTYAVDKVDLSHLPKWEFNVKFSDIRMKVSKNPQ